MYLGVVCLILLLLALDLGVFHRKAHVVSIREALGWSVFWITLGMAFSIFVYVGYWSGLPASIRFVLVHRFVKCMVFQWVRIGSVVT